jgi:hypothetical protein
MRVRIVRRGGLAGLRMAAVVDTEELARPDAARVDAELAALPWGAPAPPAAHPDEFSYQLTLLDGGAGARSVSVGQAHFAERLGPLLEAFDRVRRIQR